MTRRGIDAAKIVLVILFYVIWNSIPLAYNIVTKPKKLKIKFRMIRHEHGTAHKPI